MSATDDLTFRLAKAIRAAWVDRLDWDELVQGALEFLTSAGRLIPAGGMALTAEQVEDVRTVAGEDEELAMTGEFWAARDRLRALFPATEPAEEETKAEVVQDIEVMQWDGTRKSIQAICDWVNSFDDELDDPTISYCFSSAAPDDVLDVSLTTNEGDFVRVSDGDFIVRDTQGDFYRRDRNAYATVAASSPVVPAPTETEWQTWEEVPEGVKYYGINTWGPTYYVNRSGVRHRVFDDTPSKTADYIVQGSAPFVAAEEG